MAKLEPWRVAVVEEAKTWLRTPWHHNARVKGAGVDCGQHLIMCFINTKLVPYFETGDYSPDWMLHNTQERYLEWIEKYLDPVDTPRPGDVTAWKHGHCFSHGAIVVEWPIIIHAYKPERMVVYGDATKGLIAREHLATGGSAPRELRHYSIAGRL
jgi:cell wall-associated NlpC family hydrolase